MLIFSIFADIYFIAPPPDSKPKKSKFKFLTNPEGIDKIPEVTIKSSHH